MIAITNTSKKISEKGMQDYEVSINRMQPIAKFKHRRSDGLAMCLLLASKAVRDQEEGGHK